MPQRSRRPDLGEPWPRAAARHALGAGPAARVPQRGGRRARSAPDRVAAPASPYVLQAGAVISAALITGIRSDLPGQITAQVTENIYDSPTGRILLVPQGTRSSASTTTTCSSASAACCSSGTGSSCRTAARSCSSASRARTLKGYAGLEDGVDYHWWDLAKAAGLSTLLGVGAELAVDDEDRSFSAIRERRAGHHQRRRPADRPRPAQRRADADHPAGLSRPRDRHARPCTRTLWRLMMAKLKLGPIADDKPTCWIES
jgi:hypothetical protein